MNWVKTWFCLECLDYYPFGMQVKERGAYLPSFVNARSRFRQSGEPYGYLPVTFGLSGLLYAGANMQGQMMGSYGVRFYPLGDRTLTLVTDNKTRESYYYGLPVNNQQIL